MCVLFRKADTKPRIGIHTYTPLMRLTCVSLSTAEMDINDPLVACVRVCVYAASSRYTNIRSNFPIHRYRSVVAVDTAAFRSTVYRIVLPAHCLVGCHVHTRTHIKFIPQMTLLRPQPTTRTKPVCLCVCSQVIQSCRRSLAVIARG